jgi:tetratricopeptide (TPR) repeat protein
MKNHPELATQLHLYRGRSYSRLHQPLLAIDEFSHCLSVQKKSGHDAPAGSKRLNALLSEAGGSVYLERARAYIETKQYAAAEVDCSTVIKLEPRNLAALSLRAEARELSGKVKESIEDYKKVELLSPFNSVASEKLSILQNKLKGLK